MSDYSTAEKTAQKYHAGVVNGTILKETQKNHAHDISNKHYDIATKIIKNGKTPVSTHSSDHQPNSPNKHEIVEDGDLTILKNQIQHFAPIERIQTKLRYQSQVFVCKKRRINLFKAYDVKIARPLYPKVQTPPYTFDPRASGKPTHKNSIKLQKAMSKFIQNNGLIDYSSGKYLSPTQNINKNIQSHLGYNEKDFLKVKKYQPLSQKIPSLNFVFNQENVAKEQDEEVQQNDTKDEDFEDPQNLYDQIPQVNGYIVPKEQVPRPFSDCRRQIFKFARTLNRMKVERDGILKKMAIMAVKQVQKRYLKSVKIQNQYTQRAKKLQRQSVVYWRKRQKELIQLKKRKEKLEAQLKKRDEEQQQAKRQQKRLQFIMYQSGLYSHFMAKKLGMDGQLKNQMSKLDQGDQKKVAIDQQAAQLGVQQIMNENAANLQNFKKDDGNNKLDFSNVDQVNTPGQLAGPPQIFIGKLKEYQVKGLRWLNNLFQQGINGILADEMGLGKTIQAIALLSHISFNKNIWGPFLIVAPNSTLFNWQQQFKKFCPSLRVLPYWGSLKQRKTIRKFFSDKKFTQKSDSPFHVVITSYQLTVTDDKAFKRLKWQFMILDQAQAIKNVLSQRWNTLKEFQTRNRLLLTGTPIQNNMAQLWALLNFIMPQLFDSHQLFNQWFSKDIQAHSQDQKALDQIKIQRLHAILKPFMLRRIKKDVQHQIGKKIQHQMLCEMTKRQKKLYDSIKQRLNVKDFFKMLQSKARVENLMNLVMQLRKVCNHPQLFERRPPRSPFLFQQLYYYTGYIPIKIGQQKLISFNSKNPIVFNLPKLVYEKCLKYQENEMNKNKRILNIFEAKNQVRNSCFASLHMTSLSYGEVETCFQQDAMITKLLLAHWLLRNNYKRNLSTKQSLNFAITNTINNWHALQQNNFILPKSPLNSIINAYIYDVTAPSVIPNVASQSFYNDYELLSNNTFHKYLFEGRYKKYWKNHKLAIPEGEEQKDKYHGLLSNRKELTKLQVINFGSLIADSAKLRQLDRILKQKKKNGDRVLIFCQMTKMIDILEDFMNMKKYTFFRLDGGSNLADRRDMVNEFQTNKNIFVFLLSTRAGGLGVTLTAANTVIFYDNDWNPTMDAQATDRAHRIGQRSDVFVYQLVTKGTIQERIVKRAQQKKTVQSTVYQGASFNFFKKDMIMELINDQFNPNGNQQQGSKKKQAPGKKKGPKGKSKQEEQGKGTNAGKQKQGKQSKQGKQPKQKQSKKDFHKSIDKKLNE